jgi:hypothetical protein
MLIIRSGNSGTVEVSGEHNLVTKANTEYLLEEQ